MFGSLDEQMKRDESASSTAKERWIRYTIVLIISVLVFGRLYAGIMLLE
jgi:hypothetical protein